jgi:hypothetical protein
MPLELMFPLMLLSHPMPNSTAQGVADVAGIRSSSLAPSCANAGESVEHGHGQRQYYPSK